MTIAERVTYVQQRIADRRMLAAELRTTITEIQSSLPLPTNKISDVVAALLRDAAICEAVAEGMERALSMLDLADPAPATK